MLDNVIWDILSDERNFLRFSIQKMVFFRVADDVCGKFIGYSQLYFGGSKFIDAAFIFLISWRQ